MSGPADRAALDRVPDHPQWVDTRGMLLTGRAIVSVHGAGASRHRRLRGGARLARLALRYRRPSAIADRRTRAGAWPATSTSSSPRRTRRPSPPHCLSGSAVRVRLHALPQPQAWESEPDDDVIDRDARAGAVARSRAGGIAARDRRSPRGSPDGALRPRHAAGATALRTRLLRAVPVAFVLVDGRAVAFCYPVLQTERYWDVSVDTLEGYRGRGLAGRAARAMIRHMRQAGKSPVWGALESNAASLGVARRLGFVEAGRLLVFAAR